MGKKTSKKKKLRNQLQKDLLQIFRKEPRRSFDNKQLNQKLGLTHPESHQLVGDLLSKLSSDGLLAEKNPGKFTLKPQQAYITGTVDVTQRGAAYVVTDELEDDVYIAPRDLGIALHDDVVKVHLYAKRKRRRPEGEVVEILERARKEFVGTVEVSKKFAFLVPDSLKMHVDLYIPLENLKGARSGDKAIAKITDWPEKATNPFGEITKVLGQAGEHDVEMHAILTEYGLPYDFPKEVVEAAEKIPEEIPQQEIDRREDLRNITTFTIDPEDAQDFDDAISYRQLDNGLHEIGVHIADVSHYVEPGSVLEKEAIQRATSVYLVDRVVPMLPEKLSNKICSLRPDEDKLSFSAIFILDDEAKIQKEWFGKTVIRSDKRFTYEEAQKGLDSGKGTLAQELRQVYHLSLKLREQRVEYGSLEIESDEVKFELDENGKPLKVIPKKILDTNLMVEDLMLLANRRVAKFVGKGKNPQPFIYRIHDLPDEEKMETLKAFVAKFGYSLHHKRGKAPSYAINKLLADVKGSPEEGVISLMAIRSMAKAIYSTDNIGHFGLAFEYYTHFTSPIRRYPDLVVHRSLQRFLKEKKTAKREELEKVCKHSSMMEKQAVSAERDSIKYKQVEFMQDKIGQEFAGMVTQVTSWGIFVEIIDTRCEGMIPLRTIDDDLYNYDEKNHRITGSRNGRVINIGDELKVIPVNTDLLKKQLDLELSEHPER